MLARSAGPASLSVSIPRLPAHTPAGPLRDPREIRKIADKRRRHRPYREEGASIKQRRGCNRARGTRPPRPGSRASRCPSPLIFRFAQLRVLAVIDDGTRANPA